MEKFYNRNYTQTMAHYPSYDEKDFYDRINKIYKNYKISKSKLSIEKYCKPKKFMLQPPQEFLPQYINPKTPYKSILIYHKIGSGKTCTAIQIAEQWKDKKRIIFVLPASLKGNFKNELRGLCGGNNYLTPSERKELAEYRPTDHEYIEIIKRSDKRIEKYYDIYSYNKFVDKIQDGRMDINDSVLIIDEIQNMVSETGLYYSNVLGIINNSENVRVILLSATPMFDKPVEIGLTMKLLNPDGDMPVGREFEKMFISTSRRNNKIFYTTKNMDLFKEMIKGYISYYAGAPEYTFPTISIKYVECIMSDFQHDVYKKIIANKGNKLLYEKPPKNDLINAIDLPNNFYIGARSTSNIVFPNKKVSDAGLESFTETKIRNNLAKYSCKISKIMSYIRRSKGKIFIYSGFKEYAGLKSLIKVLEAFGYKNYKNFGAGRKRFAVWSGEESMKIKDEIREIYNHHNNLYGEKLKIILGSPAIKEGVTLKSVRHVHILEPYWNKSRLDQVIGRANRFCSHIGLPKDERDVKVYIYVATHPDEVITVDQYIRRLSDTKNKIIKQFEKAIKEASIDCRLNKNANETDKEHIICE